MPNNTSASPLASPLITFVVPAYNTPAALLAQCIGSIMQLPLQSGEREIVLIDDGSDTPAIDAIPQYAAHIVYRRQQNSGLGAARNAAIDIARGRYIQFVDSDDRLVLPAYSQVLDVVKEGVADIVYFRLSPTPAVSARRWPFSQPVGGVTLLLGQCLRVASCGYVFRRSVLGTLRFTQGIYHEDEEFTPLLFLKAHRIVCTDAPAYYYRECAGSITHRCTDDHLRSRFGSIETVIARLHDCAATMKAESRKALHRRIAHLTLEYLYHVARLTHSTSAVDAAIRRLRDAGFYPVPLRHLGHKHLALRLAFATKMGQWGAVWMLGRGKM